MQIHTASRSSPAREDSPARRRKESSDVWSLFDKIDNDTKAKCKSCTASFVISSGSTTSLWRHWKKMHEPTKKGNEITNFITAPAVTGAMQRKFDNAVLDMMTQDLQPFSLVEKEGFKTLCLAFSPGYTLPSRRCFTTMFDDAYEKKKKKIAEITRAASFPSYAMDLWKSRGKDYFVSISIHFISDQWKLESFVVCCRHFQGNHDSPAVGGFVGECLKEFVGDNVKLFSGVTDGGAVSTVPFTASKLGYKIEARNCSCHQLNNMIKKIVSCYLEADYLVPWRAFIKAINQSNPFKEAWDKCCVGAFGKKIKLQKDCPTRWSSTVVMIRKAVKTKEAVKQMIGFVRQEQRLLIPDLSEEEWKELEDVGNLFDPTIMALRLLEGDRYPTQSLILFIIAGIEEKALELKASCDKQSVCNTMACRFLDEIVRLWDKLPMETLVGAFLDPRFKSLDFANESERKEVWEMIQGELTDEVRSCEAIQVPTEGRVEVDNVSISKNDKKRQREIEALQYFAKKRKVTVTFMTLVTRVGRSDYNK